MLGQLIEHVRLKSYWQLWKVQKLDICQRPEKLPAALLVVHFMKHLENV